MPLRNREESKLWTEKGSFSKRKLNLKSRSIRLKERSSFSNRRV